jgi:tRNA dimethylallyltransferase
MAHREIDRLLADGARVIVVGGTGLYMRAALADLDLRPAPAPEVRERWMRELAVLGPGPLHALLAGRAPGSAARIHATDSHRIVRALELHEIGALGTGAAGAQLWNGEMRHPTRLIGLVMAREELYARIDARVERMIEAGAEQEVIAALAAGASPTAQQALGFSELLAGDIEALKRRTRNYAKRQLTWLRKLPNAEIVDVTGRAPDEVAAALQ